MLLPMVASADVRINGIYYYLYKTTAEVAKTPEGAAKYTGSITIPSAITYKGKRYPVTRIGYDAFRDCDGLTSVTIPNSVTEIGEQAFRACSSLKSITIPNRVTFIEHHAFAWCDSLASVTIPNSVTNIEVGAFVGCI